MKYLLVLKLSITTPLEVEECMNFIASGDTSITIATCPTVEEETLLPLKNIQSPG